MKKRALIVGIVLMGHSLSVDAAAPDSAVITLNKPEVPFATHAPYTIGKEDGSTQVIPSHIQTLEIPPVLRDSTISFYPAEAGNNACTYKGASLGKLKIGTTLANSTPSLTLDLKNAPANQFGHKRICPLITLANGTKIPADNGSRWLRATNENSDFYLSLIEKKGPIFEAKNTKSGVDGDQCAWATPSNGSPKKASPVNCSWFRGPCWNELWLCKHFGCPDHCQRRPS